MPLSPVVFLDIETCGLALDDDIWEVAAIRREPGEGTEATLHLFVEHDPVKCARLPEPFLSDHRARFPTADRYDGQHYADGERRVTSREKAADLLAILLSDQDWERRPHIVGAVPSFDTERIALLLAAHGYAPGWHHHLIDVENLAVGWLANSGGQFTSWHDIAPPYDSEVLSRSVGVLPEHFAHHTAMGDARWARAIYDRIVGDAQRARDLARSAPADPLDAETPQALS